MTPIRRVLLVRGLRALGDGCMSLLLPFYLTTLGLDAVRIGVLVTATLLGSGIISITAGLLAQRFGTRSLLCVAGLMMAATGVGFATASAYWPLLLIAFAGTLNPSSGDVSLFLPLEHAVLARASSSEQRTAVFARYGLTATLLAAAGSLLASLPEMLARHFALDLHTALQGAFICYGLVGVAASLTYRRLPHDQPEKRTLSRPHLVESRSIVVKLALLFSLDSFGGGFVVQSMLALWLFERFDLPLATAGSIFFWAGLLSALSYPLAARLAERFGAIRTMVFTHLPANLLLVAAAFMPTLPLAVAFLLGRAALSQMDVPVRSAFVMNSVPEHERPAAASLTNVPRSLATALSPSLAGWLLAASSFGWPLVLAGSLKIGYDLLLYRMFRENDSASDVQLKAPDVR